MGKLLLIVILVYASIAALMFMLQSRFVFPAGLAGGEARLLPGSDALSVVTPDGETLHGLHLPPSHAGERSDPVLLLFSGNATNAADAAGAVHDLLPAYDLVAFHYRGYAPSSGRPSGAALVEDAMLVHDTVSQRFPGRPVVAIGLSVGSGVAASLARFRDLAGLILVTPFDALGRVAASHYPWLPVRWLFRHDIDAAAALEDRRVPTAIIAAAEDQVVPPERTDALRRRVPNLVLDRTVPTTGHNDIYGHPQFRIALNDALQSVRTGRPERAARAAAPE